MCNTFRCNILKCYSFFVTIVVLPAKGWNCWALVQCLADFSFVEMTIHFSRFFVPRNDNNLNVIPTIGGICSSVEPKPCRFLMPRNDNIFPYKQCLNANIKSKSFSAFSLCKALQVGQRKMRLKTLDLRYVLYKMYNLIILFSLFN